MYVTIQDTVKIYNHNFTRLLKISINNHTLLYLRINTIKSIHRIFYHDTYKIMKKKFFFLHI